MYGNILKELRSNKNLKQTELATMLTTTQSTIGKYEREEVEPNIEMLKKIADFFDCTIDYIVGRESEDGIITQKNFYKSKIEEMYEQLNRQNQMKTLGYITALLENKTN